MKNGKRNSNFLASWYLKKFELTIILLNFLLISFQIGPYPNQALLLCIFNEYFAFLMFWGLKIRLWKCLRGGRDRISCHGVLLDRTTTLWTENWCRCRPSTTCSQRTSTLFNDSAFMMKWLDKAVQALVII